MRRTVAPLVALALVAGTFALAVAMAAPPPPAKEKPRAKLTYVRSAAASTCPDEAGVRQSVAARLGYDPFDSTATKSITVTIARDATGHQASIEVRDATGKVTGKRQLSSSSNDCSELASSVSLALTIAIDPFVGMGTPSVSVSASGSTSAKPPASASVIVQDELPRPIYVPPAASTVDAPPPPADLTRAHVTASLGGLTATGIAPSLSFGVTAGASVRFRIVSIGLEGRVDSIARAQADNGGEVQSSVVLVSLLPCLHQDVFLVCAHVAMGALRGAGDRVGAPKKDTTVYSAAGARIGFEFPAAPWIAIRVAVDLLATITRTTLKIDGAEAWVSPPLSGTLGLAFVGHFR